MDLVCANTALALTNASLTLGLDFLGQFALNPMTRYSLQLPNTLPSVMAVYVFVFLYYLSALILAQLLPLVSLFLSLSALPPIQLKLRPTKIP